MSVQSLIRHRDAHLPTAAMREGAQAIVAAEAAHGASLAEEASSLRARALSLLSQAEKAGDLRTALAGVREARGCIELSAKLAGEIDTSTTVNLAIAPQWLTLQTVILNALAPHPAARLAVAAALEGTQ